MFFLKPPFEVKTVIPAVDGRNPAPVDMENLPLFTGCYTSQVVQDFFHQQCQCISSLALNNLLPIIEGLPVDSHDNGGFILVDSGEVT